MAKSAETGKSIASKSVSKIVKVVKEKKEDEEKGGSETPRNNGGVSKVKVSVEKHISDKIGKATGKKAGAKDDDNDDPIEKSLNERIAAGGVTQVVKGANPVKPVVTKPVKPSKDKKEEEEKTGDTKDGNKTELSKIKGALEKHIDNKVTKLIGKKAGKDDDSDDPIA